MTNGVVLAKNERLGTAFWTDGKGWWRQKKRLAWELGDAKIQEFQLRRDLSTGVQISKIWWSDWYRLAHSLAVKRKHISTLSLSVITEKGKGII